MLKLFANKSVSKGYTAFGMGTCASIWYVRDTQEGSRLHQPRNLEQSNPKEGIKTGT